MYNEESVRQVDVPTFSGYLGVLREHVPTIAMLQPGVVVVHGEKEQKYFGELWFTEYRVIVLDRILLHFYIGFG